MNDRDLADMLAELDAELARRSDPDAARQVLAGVEARVPGSVQRLAAGLQLRQLGCATTARW
ncbi:hypothetical protein [Brevundimonas sp.]|uniref:hypothetical protein n=1 Tax=Brevundimonas sp. TaxID=1871086 RepID=UPI001A3250E2|nr:hypothetical protein [Brevundimonas sp.]MBJ7484354.1 hypothetical protein [Brevundimonas sp.]